MCFELSQNEFGKRIAECRRKMGLTQEELANRIGVTPQALSQYERGVRYPDVSLIKPLCTILQVSADYLLQIEEKIVAEDGNPKIQDEIWRNLRNALEPLKIIFGRELLPVFEDTDFQAIAELRVKLSRQGILMPVVRIYDEFSLNPREFHIVAYNNVLYKEDIPAEQTISLPYIVDKLRETVTGRYDEILSVDMIKDLTDNLRFSHSALIEGIVPEKISYSMLTSICKGFVKRGNSLIYLPRIIEIMMELQRSGKAQSDEEILDCLVAGIKGE